MTSNYRLEGTSHFGTFGTPGTLAPLGGVGSGILATMKTHAFAGFLTSVVLAGCAQPTPEQRFLNDAADALGGRNRIGAARTLTIEGEGTNYNLGQDMKPEASTQEFLITGYTRQIDLANARQRLQQTRTPQFAYFQGPQPQTQVQGLDGAVAFNVNAAGAATRVGAQAEQDRRAELFHHPLALLRAAVVDNATLSNVRPSGALRQADVTTAAGVMTLSIDATGLPVSISSPSAHPNLGDVMLTTTFADYQDVSGLQLPARMSGRVDDFTMWTLRATAQAIDGDVGDLAAPAAAAAPAALPPPSVTAEPVAKGVWFLAGQSHHSALIEFSDHLMLIEAPQSEARTLAVIAKARETVPGKPLTHLVTTHHHFDHTAGLRAAIAEGLTVITHSGNRAWVEAMAARPHTRQPDALAKTPRPVTVAVVDDEREFTDAAMVLTLYQVARNPHSDTMLMAYVPGARVIIEVDAYSPASASHPYATNLWENIQKRKLRVDRIVPLHGTIGPAAALAKVATAKTN